MCFILSRVRLFENLRNKTLGKRLRFFKMNCEMQITNRLCIPIKKLDISCAIVKSQRRRIAIMRRKRRQARWIPQKHLKTTRNADSDVSDLSYKTNRTGRAASDPFRVPLSAKVPHDKVFVLVKKKLKSSVQQQNVRYFDHLVRMCPFWAHFPIGHSHVGVPEQR